MDRENKLVIIINGKGGTGKDTVCALTARHYRTRNVSSIDPIKAIARQHGWNGEKDTRARKFLSDLKQAFVDYNDLPNRFLEEQYQQFLDSDEGLMFVHIREGAQINAFKERVFTKCVTLLVHSPLEGLGEAHYGNVSDDQAEDYPYDYRYQNDRPLEELEEDFLAFLQELLHREGVELPEIGK